MGFKEDGYLITDKRSEDAGDTLTWETQTDWEGFQEKERVEIENGTVKLESVVIPDSVEESVFQFDARSLSGYSDGDTVNEWEDMVDAQTITGTGTFRSNGINGYESVELDGVDDGFDNNFDLVNPPLAIISVVQKDEVTDNLERISGDQKVEDNRFRVRWAEDGWSIFGGGSSTTGTDDITKQLITGFSDGEDAILRENGDQEAIDHGSNDESLDPMNIGYRPDSDDGNFDGLIGYVEVLQGVSISDVEDREVEVADSWGIDL